MIDFFTNLCYNEIRHPLKPTGAPAPRKEAAMSAPTKSRLPVVALVVSILALVVSIAALGDGLRASQATYRQPTPSPARSSTPSPAEGPVLNEGEPVTRRQQEKFLVKGEAAVRRWGRERFDKGVRHDNVALAYLCLAKSSEAGRYYAGALVDNDQFYGIGPYGTRRGDPVKTAKAVCASLPEWAK